MWGGFDAPHEAIGPTAQSGPRDVAGFGNNSTSVGGRGNRSISGGGPDPSGGCAQSAPRQRCCPARLVEPYPRAHSG